MKLLCLGSSSSGNCYILTSSARESLIIECGHITTGISIDKALSFDYSGVVGCLVSHKHADHCGGADKLMQRGVSICTHAEVIDNLSILKSVYARQLKEKAWNAIGAYKVYPLPLKHCNPDGSDCKCWGFIIEHGEMGRMLFATDTVVFPYRLPKLNHIFIEANYDDETLQYNIENGIEDAGKRNRLLVSHLELSATAQAIKAQDLTNVNEVVLLHLSARNSNSTAFAEYLSQLTGLPTYIARPGVEIDLTIQPY